MEGYDAKFDPPLEKRLECPICLLAQREPMQTPCGHRFCSACILRALRETGQRCPVDNTTVCIHQLFRDNFAKREVLSLNVHCSADQSGCSWQGELRELQVHNKQCELVVIECPNMCGHSCQRQNLLDHLPNCANRPEKCATCSVCFRRSAQSEHQPYCANITIPDSVSSSIDKAGEELKWVGHLKLKLNGQVCQVTGYLTAPRDGEHQSRLTTSSWSTNITFITLNNMASQIFSRMLMSSEVQPVILNLALLSNDPRSVIFYKTLRNKPDHCHAAVCLRLRPGNRRDTRELTILYLCWCDQQKKLQAHIANLKTHLVRQIQTHLQDIQGSRRHRRIRGPSSHSGQPPSSSLSSSSSQSQSRLPGSTPHHDNRAQPSYPSRPRGAHSSQHHQQRQQQQQQQQQQQHLATGGLQAQHPAHQPLINIQPLPPHQVVAAAAAGSSPAILPNLLSWQMSQSFNTYPWRMQAAGVPFFTFPSTPPSYIPANSYPYTFAPLPAAPFSISPMQPTTVPMPSYNGLSVVVPQVTTVDAANAVSLNTNQASVVTQGYAAAAVPSQPVLDRELQAVAVTLSGEGSQVLHVIQPHGSTRPPAEHPIHRYAAATAQGVMATNAAPPALIHTDHHINNTPQQPQMNQAPPPAPLPGTVPHQPSNASNPPPPPPPPHPPSFIFEVPPSVSTGATGPLNSSNHQSSSSSVRQLQPGGSGSSFRPVPAPVAPPAIESSNRGIWEVAIPGPSGLNDHPQLQSELQSDSSRDSTPDAPSFSLFSPSEDSDHSDTSQLTEISISPNPLFDQSPSVLSSDLDDSSLETIPHNISTDTSTNSALHTLADAAAILADSPNSSNPQPPSSSISAVGEGAGEGVRIPVGASSVPAAVRVPVLINISDSESDSRMSPASIIDLTQSPTVSSRRGPPSLAQGNHYGFSVNEGPHPRQALRTHGATRQPQEPQPQVPSVHGENHAVSAVLVPVIHHWNGANEQGLHPIPQYVPEPVGVMQATPVQVDEAHVVHQASGNLNPSEVAAVQMPPTAAAAAYPIHDYTTHGSVAAWPAEVQAPSHPVQHALIYPPPPPPPPPSHAPPPQQPQPVQPVVAGLPPPRGDFWDTVIPSLDMTLQNSSNTDN